MVMKESRAKSLWSWNSPLSIGFDVIFGVIPAIVFGYLSLFPLTYYLLNFQGFSLTLSGLGELLFGFFWNFANFFACFFLIYITFNRTTKVAKPIVIPLLLIGFCTSIYFTFNLGFSFVSIAAISIAMVAVKHITMLSRANSEVKP